MVIFASGDDRRVPGANLHTNFKLGLSTNYLGLFNADFPPQAASAICAGLSRTAQRHFLRPGQQRRSRLFRNSDSGRTERFQHHHRRRGAIECQREFGIFQPADQCGSDDGDAGRDHSLHDRRQRAEHQRQRDQRKCLWRAGQHHQHHCVSGGGVCAESFADAHALAQTYLFTEAIIRQPNNPPGYPTGNVWTPTPNEVDSASLAYYEMDPTVVNDPQYTNDVRAGLTSIPTMSIILPIPSLFDPNTGIYTHPDNHSNTGGADEWERACSMELIFPDGSPEAQIDCGLQIQGGSSRYPTKNPKHSFRVSFKSIYGPGKFKFPMFADSPVTSFNTFVIDGGNNYWWQYFGTVNPPDQRNRAQDVRDQFTSDLMLAMGNALLSRTILQFISQRTLLGNSLRSRTAGRRFRRELFRRRQHRLRRGQKHHGWNANCRRRSHRLEHRAGDWPIPA